MQPIICLLVNNHEMPTTVVAAVSRILNLSDEFLEQPIIGVFLKNVANPDDYIKLLKTCPKNVIFSLANVPNGGKLDEDWSRTVNKTLTALAANYNENEVYAIIQQMSVAANTNCYRLIDSIIQVGTPIVAFKNEVADSCCIPQFFATRLDPNLWPPEVPSNKPAAVEWTEQKVDKIFLLLKEAKLFENSFNIDEYLRNHPISLKKSSVTASTVVNHIPEAEREEFSPDTLHLNIFAAAKKMQFFTVKKIDMEHKGDRLKFTSKETGVTTEIPYQTLLFNGFKYVYEMMKGV